MSNQTDEHSEAAAHQTHTFGEVSGGITFVPNPPERTRTGLSTTGDAAKCSLGDDSLLECWHDFFPPPVVRQWLSDGRLYREAQERVPSRFELFFDLVLVGVVHQIADLTTEHVSGPAILKVILTFYPAASIWMNLRNWLNVCGSDSMLQRVQLLLTIIGLLGYSVNATAITVEHRVHTELDNSTWPLTASQAPIRASVTFFLCTKFLRASTYLYYAYALPEFRSWFIALALGIIAMSAWFVGIYFVESLAVAAVLVGLGSFTEVALRFSTGIALYLERKRKSKSASQSTPDEVSEAPETAYVPRMFPAFSIEHIIERNAAFITVVLGESVVSLLYTANKHNVGFSPVFGRSVLALVVVFVLNAVYFDHNLSKKFIHAIRRSWITNIVWDMLHFPLSLGIILGSAAVGRIVTQGHTPRLVQWQYSLSLGGALASITFIGLCHEDKDAPNASHVKYVYRAIIRLIFSVVFALLPLVPNLDDTGFLLYNASAASVLVIIELWAKIGVQGHIYLPEEEPIDVAEEDREQEAEEEIRRQRE